jgi:regulator of sigma E protease
MLLIISVIGCAAVAMLIHELGHLLAARLCRVPASELGLGMGRKFATFRIASIKLSFGVLPTGSFVMLDGAVLKQRTLSQQLFVHLGGSGQGIWLLKATLFDGSSYSVWVEIKK